MLTAGTVPSANKDPSFSAFGNRGMQNVYLLDGGLNESFIRGIDNHQRDALRPSLEAIQEFKVQTSNYSAEYGSSAGGVVSVVTKSGTNEIHGSVFEFLRNSAIRRAKTFSRRRGAIRYSSSTSTAASLGGPIKKNRAWIFGAYQRHRHPAGHGADLDRPTPAAKNGVFTTPDLRSRDDRAERQHLHAHAVPQQHHSGLALQLRRQSCWRTGIPIRTCPAAANNYIRTAPVTTNLHNATFRGDVQVSSKDTMFARFSLNTGQHHGEPPLPAAGRDSGDPATSRLELWLWLYARLRPDAGERVPFRLEPARQLPRTPRMPRDEIVPGRAGDRRQQRHADFRRHRICAARAASRPAAEMFRSTRARRSGSCPTTPPRPSARTC